MSLPGMYKYNFYPSPAPNGKALNRYNVTNDTTLNTIRDHFQPQNIDRKLKEASHQVKDKLEHFFNLSLSSIDKNRNKNKKARQPCAGCVKDRIREHKR